MKSDQNRSPEGNHLVPLIQRAKKGDQQAYSELYEATEREVYRSIRAMIRSEELARDVQQEVYVYAFTHLDSLREPEKLRAWLRSIAVNQSYTALRQVSPVLFSELENEEGKELPELADLSGDTEPELTLERKETARYVREILDGLTNGQRAVVAMYYYEQLPVSEIAEDLGVSPGNVKTQLFRSRKKIEAAVKRLEEKGVKLFGLAPLPFLVALLKKLTPAAEQSKTVMAGALTKAGVAPVAEAAAVHVGRSFFQTVLGKVVLGIIAAGVVAGGAAGWRWYQENFRYGDLQPPSETLEINLHVDTDEDLTTEPTTEPVTTGPDPTEPTDPAPQPTDPTTPTEPEPDTSESVEISVDWRWLSSGDGGSSDTDEKHFIVTVTGGVEPFVYANRKGVVELSGNGLYAVLPDGKKEYEWVLRKIGSGDALVYCELGDEFILLFSVSY